MPTSGVLNETMAMIILYLNRLSVERNELIEGTLSILKNMQWHK
jgi:hypothetical protein